jgi:hypothetical protein
MVMMMGANRDVDGEATPTPRRSCDDDDVNFQLTGGSGAAGSALSMNRRGLLPPPLPL